VWSEVTWGVARTEACRCRAGVETSLVKNKHKIIVTSSWFYLFLIERRVWKAIGERLLKSCYLSRDGHNRKIRIGEQRCW
jgi:hypothetical protein